MGKFSYDDYMNLKKKGLVSWDDDLIKGHSKNLNDFVKGTSSLTEESFDDNVSKLRELEDQHRYVQTYINSLEGSGSYNGAKRSFDSIDATLNKAKGFYGQFKDSKAYGEALKQQKEAQAAEKQAKAQADEYRYNSKYQDFSYDELTRASKSTAPNLDESERNWLKKAAQNKATAQEYYEKELAPIEARMKELDEQYMQTHYSTPEMQNEYAKLRKQLDEKENIYKQKKDNQAAVNNAVEKREENIRYSQKYQNKSASELVDALVESDSEKEKEWLRERLKNTLPSSDYDKEIERFNSKYSVAGENNKSLAEIQRLESKINGIRDSLENDKKAVELREKKENYYKLAKNPDFAENSKDISGPYIYETRSQKEGTTERVKKYKTRDERGELDNKKYMTDEEQRIYNYLVNTRGNEAAEDFFKSIEPDLNKRMTETKVAKAKELAENNPFAASIDSLGQNLISSGGIVEDIYRRATGQFVDNNSFFNLPANINKAERSTVAENIEDPVGQWIYNTTMSIADNAINMLVAKGVGKVAGLAGASASTVNNVAANATSIIMGSQVATQTVIDCKDKGMDDGTAIGLGLIHGLVEHITEKVSIENILSDPRTFKQALKKSFVSEGSEEVAANWLDRAADALIMGDKSKERQDFENFKAQGMNDIEAFGQVMLGCLGEDADAFLAGGVSGIVMSGVSHGFDKVTKGIVKGNEFNKIAEEASKKTDFDERKKELIKEAKESGDKKAVKMAESFERTIERHNGDLSAIKVGDVANIMRVLDDARQNAIESGNEAAAEQQSTVDSIIESSARTMERSKIANKSFNDIGLGAVKGKRVNLNAFGASHPKGIRVTQNSNPSISHDIVRIESSAKEYGEKENTVVLKTSDGRYINADEVTMPTKTYDTLIREAKNYDTNGARGLLANYEGYADYCKRSGKEADVKEYIQQYDALYDLGRHGVRAESMRTGGSARFNSIADAIGIEQAENALNTGANDADAVFMHENNVMLKMRMPGQKHAADSKVVIDVSEGEELNISDDQKNILQAIAQKTGRTIVLTDKLSENVSGTFAPDGKIYINSKIENSNYGVAVALHEAIHGLRTAAPMEYNALKKFIVNYLVEQGENIDDLLDDIALNWGKDAASEEARLEELVAQSVMALATDDAALKKAIECKENKKLLNKVLDAIKSIAEKVREFIKGTLKDGKITGAHNKQAQFWTENLKALDELAEKFSKAMDEQRVAVQETTQERNQGGVRYSFGGERARNADKTALATAKQLDADGKSSEEIRQKTGWHKGYDGKWRFEIDDSMAKLVENPPLKLQGNNDDGYYRTAKLGDVLEHSKLFEAYPQLKNVTVIIQETEPGVEGISFNESKQIVLSQKLFERTTEEFKKLQESKQEEIKRIEQTAEYNEYNKYYQMDFSSVETPEQWLKEEKAARDKFFNSELGKRYYQLQWGKTNVQKTELGWSDKALSVLMHEVQHQIQKIEEFASGSNGKNKDYYNTAGEVEARDVQQRLNLNAEQRQKKRPDIDRDEVVFSNYSGRNSVDDSIDADYLSAVERGDTKTAQRMVDEAAKTAGYKSADPVTYDDNGNVIPLSERFKSNNNDIRYAVDDTIYDFITDEYGNAETAEDFERIAEKEPKAAIKLIYRKAVEIGKSLIESNRNVKLNENDYNLVAGKVLESLGVDIKKNGGAVSEFSKSIEQFIENARALKGSNLTERTQNNYFRNQYEGLAAEIGKYVKLSEQFTNKKKNAVERDVFNFIGNNTLLLRDYEIPLIQKEFGTVKALRTKMLGKTFVGYDGSGKSGYHIEDLVDYINKKHPEVGYKWGVIEDGGEYGWFDNLVNNYLNPKLKRTGEGDVTYYEDEKSAGFEAAMQTLSELGKVFDDKLEGRVKLSDEITAIDQNTVALRNAKLKLARERSKYQALKNKWDNNLIVIHDSINRELRQEFEDRATKASTINGIRRIVKRFRSAVMNPTDERFVPPAAIRAGIFDAFEAMGNAVITRDGTKTADAMRDMLNKINELTKESKYGDADLDYSEEFDEDFKSAVRELIVSLEDTNSLPDYKDATIEDLTGEKYKKISSRTLTVAEAKEIYNLMKEIEGKIIDARRQLLREENITNRESGERIIEQVNAVKSNHQKGTQLISGLGAQFFNAMRAARMFSNYDDNAELMYHTNALNEGRRKGEFWAMKAEKMFTELTEKRAEEYRKSLRDIISVDFEGSDGKAHTLKITKMQGLTILMQWEREMRSGNSMIHMRTGGIEVVDSKNERKEHAKIHDNMQKVTGVNSKMIAAIEAKMGSFEREYRKIAEKFFNEVSKQAINETMLVLKHREIANSKYYIPVWVDENFTTAEISALKFDATIEGRGNYKNTVKSSLPIIITSLNSIVDQHIKDTAKLYGEAIPLRNFKKAFRVNGYSKGNEGKNWFATDSVKNALTKKFGNHAVTFFENMITDREAGRNQKSSAIMRTLYKGRVVSALAANLSVVIKQAASYPTAGKYLSAKSLSAGLAKFAGKSFTRRYSSVIDEIDRHTAQHYMRRKGMSVQEVADMMNSISNKLPKKLKPLNPLKWIQGVDCVTTAALWEAVKAEINTKYKNEGNETGGEKYWQEVTELYDKVIEDTQPMNDSLHKAEIQKGGTDMRKSVFLFETQPLQNTGILFDAIGEVAAKKGKDGSLKRLGKTVASQASTLLVYASMTFIGQMLLHKLDRWRDEKDEITAQSVTRVMFGDLIDNFINLVAPYGGNYVEGIVKDFYNTAANGKLESKSTLEAASLSFLDDIRKKAIRTDNIVANELRKGDKCDFGKIVWNIFDMVGEGSQVGGVPYNNIKNIVNSAKNYWFDFNVNKGLTNNKGNLYTEHMPNHIVDYMKNGNKEEADKYVKLWQNELVSSGKSENEAMSIIKNKIAAVLTQTDSDVTDAFVAHMNGDTTKYKKLFDKLEGYGFDPSDIDKAIDGVKSDIFAAMKKSGVEKADAKDDLMGQGFSEEAANKLSEEYLKPAKEQKESAFDDTSEGKKVKFSNKDGLTALKNGDKKTYEQIREYIVEHDSNVESNEAFDKMMRSLTYTRDIVDGYLEAMDNKNEALREMYKKQLINIYGSWDDAGKVVLKRDKNKRKKK